MLLAGLSSPTQLVPNPFSWSQNTFFYRYLSFGRSNKNSKNNINLFFLILLLAGLSSPSQLVPNPFNWSPNSVFFSDISASVAQMKKIQKTRSIYFLILLLAGLSSPSQLVPNPFNWSSKVFLTDIPVSVAKIKKNKKFKKQYPFIFKCCFSQDFPYPVNWSPAH